MNKKKNIIIIICLLIVILSSLAVCYFLRSKKSVEVEQMVFYDRVYLNDNDTTLGAISINLNIELPTTYIKKDVLANIKTILKAELFGELYMSTPEDSVLSHYANDLKNDYIDTNKDFAQRIKQESLMSFNNEVILEGFSLLNDSHIFSYGISRFVDFGGAHPIKTRKFYNFDLKTGNVIFEEDIFKDNSLQELAEIMKLKLKQDLSDKHDQNNYNGYISESDYSFDDVKPNHNFYVNDESICFVFNPYDIAPYYIGETVIEIPYKSIEHLFKTKNPLSYLINNINQSNNSTN
ncbi:hypothetical protein MASR2M117_04590 [Paludibacter sp.]